MATTTNYGWTTPDDTALVKDGAAAIRTLGSSVDSTLKTQIDAQIAKSTITTKGDLIVGTGAGTFIRQGIGTNGQVLVADSAEADGLKWASPTAGSLTLISTTTLSGSSTTISSIPSTYTNLVLVMKDLSLNSSNFQGWFRFNGATSLYDGGYSQFAGSSISSDIGSGDKILFGTMNSSSTNPVYALATIPRYSSGDARKFITLSGTKQGSGTNIFANGCLQLTDAISSITVGTTNTYTSGTVYLYGVN